MGSLKTLALASAVALGVPAFASAADFPISSPPPPPPESLGLKGTISSGVYLRGDIGVGQLQTSKYYQQDVASVNGTFFGAGDTTTVFAGAGLGYRFNNWFRVDGTLEYRGGAHFSVNDKLTYNNGFGIVQQSNSYKGNISSMVALFNAYVDLGTWYCLTPYIGAGIGYATNTISGMTDQGIVFAGGPSSATLGTAGNGDKSGVAWALMAGVGYEVNKNLTLEAGYRYLNLGEAQSGRIQNAFLNQSYAPLKVKELESHDFKIGMRWNFGEPDCCGPTERVAPYYPPTVRKF